jgi:hypothetical protein
LYVSSQDENWDTDSADDWSTVDDDDSVECNDGRDDDESSNEEVIKEWMAGQLKGNDRAKTEFRYRNSVFLKLWRAWKKTGLMSTVIFINKGGRIFTNCTNGDFFWFLRAVARAVVANTNHTIGADI